MNPLTEQRVHLSGNPIKSQGEMLLCLPLIIASLPCTAATALFLEVYWDSGAGGRWWGESGSLAGGGKEKRGEGGLLTMHTVLARCTACATSVRLFCTSPSFFFFSLPLPLFLSLSLSLPPLPSTPLSVPFFNLLFIA